MLFSTKRLGYAISKRNYVRLFKPSWIIKNETLMYETGLYRKLLMQKQRPAYNYPLAQERLILVLQKIQIVNQEKQK